MLTALALTLALAPQDPGTAQDVVRLSVGTELAGRIVLETADYLEIELAPGTTVGLAKSKIDSIERADTGARAAVDTTAEPRAPLEATARRGPGLRACDDWHVVHDGAGRAVGWMHATVTPDGDGGFRIGEEWSFVEDGRTVETTVLDTIDAEGRPRTTFSHQRIRAADGRLSGDRLVRAVVEDGLLRVQVQSKQGFARRSYKVLPEMRFPLELREELRTRPAGAKAREAFPVFDPLTEDFETRSFEVGDTRRVHLGRGDATPLRTLTGQGVRGENSEWLDASARPLRREVAGPALVAVRVGSEAEARQRAAAKGSTFPPSFRTEQAGRFGLWLPSPAWQFVDAVGEDEVTARAEVDGASMALVRLPQLSADLGVDSAADSVVRWLRLAHRDLRIGSREVRPVRGADAVRIRADAVRHDGEVVELLVHVLRVDEQWFASCGAAPRHAFARLEPELAWMVERFELRREGFAPELRGPLAGRDGAHPGSSR